MFQVVQILLEKGLMNLELLYFTLFSFCICNSFMKSSISLYCPVQNSQGLQCICANMHVDQRKKDIPERYSITSITGIQNVIVLEIAGCCVTNSICSTITYMKPHGPEEMQKMRNVAKNRNEKCCQKLK